jgi:phosphoserine phosphatase RsbU/P
MRQHTHHGQTQGEKALLTGSLPGDEPEWKQFLLLGESLLNLPNTAAQCRLIAKTIRQTLGCHATVWLATSYYPLPGEPPVPLLSHPRVPPLVAIAAEKGNLVEDDQTSNEPFSALAVPMITQDNILGIIHVRRNDRRIPTEKCINFVEGLAAHAALAFQISRQVVLKNWRYEQLSLVSSVSNQIANETDLDKLCQRVTELIQITFHYYSVAVFTLENNSDLLRQRGSASEEGITETIQHQIHLGEGIVGHVAQSGVEFLTQDVNHEPLYRYVDFLPDTQSEIVLPLSVDNRLMGVLDVQSTHLNGFHEIDLLVLRALSDNIAIAVDGARLYQDIQNRAEQIAAVFEVSRALASILDLDQLLNELVILIHKHFGYPYIHVFTVHNGRRKIFFHTGSGIRSKTLKGRNLTYDLDDPTGLIPWAARENLTILINDVHSEPRYRPSELPPANTLSEMVVPFAYAGEVLGVLDIQSDNLNAFSREDQDLFEALAVSIAATMRNANLFRAEKWRREVADSFRDVAELVSSNVVLEKLLDTILSRLEQHLPCEASAIWLLQSSERPPDGPSVGLRLASSRGISPETLEETLHDPETQMWLQRAMRVSEPTIRKGDDPYGPLGASLGYDRDYSSIAAPLRAGDQTLGLLTLAHPTGGRYGSEASTITKTFASYAAVAIQSARLFAASQEQAWMATVLLQVAEVSQTAATVDELLATMARLTPLLVGVQKCAFFKWEQTIQMFSLEAWYGIDIFKQDKLFSIDHAPALARMAAERATQYIQNADAELNFPDADIPDGTGTQVLIPLLSRNELLGAFLVTYQVDGQSLVEHSFSDEMLTLLQGMAHQTSTAMENLLLIETRQQEGYVTAVLLQVAQAVVSQNQLSDILDTIVHLMPILVGISDCVIFLWDDHKKIYHPAQVFTAVRQEEEILKGRDYDEGEFILLDQVRGNDQAFYAVLENDRMPAESWTTLAGRIISTISDQHHTHPAGWLLGYPLSIKGEFYGVLLAKDAISAPALLEKRLEIINGIAQQTTLAIQNEMFNLQTVEREKVEREFQLARQIQQTFLPDVLPHASGWEIDKRWVPAQKVGGDFYDVFKVGENHLGFVIADVSDKGMPAALYMTVARTLIRANARTSISPAVVLQQVNNQLLADTENGMFITAIYAMVSTSDGEIIYANAGHNRLILLHGTSGLVEMQPKGGIALGVVENAKLVDEKIHLRAGDSLLFYTDGVTDTLSSTGEEFGEQRFLAVLNNLVDRKATSMLQQIDNTLAAFQLDEPASDDITMIAIHRKKKK